MAWNGSTGKNTNGTSKAKRHVGDAKKSPSIMRGAFAALAVVALAVGSWLWLSRQNESVNTEPSKQAQKPKETRNSAKSRPQAAKEESASKTPVAAKPEPQRFGKYEVEIDENGERYVRMANLCVVGTSSVNGVAELHTEILKKTLFKDFYELWPEKFHNVTNGITPRRWLLKANPSLSQLISESIGDSWITHLDDLKKLEKFSGDSNFLAAMAKIKRSNKGQLANWTKKNLGIELNPDAIFDVQVKRLHEYKRQLMLAIYIVMFYNRLINNPKYDPVPRQFIFAAKAAPGYYMAKLIIRFIHGIAGVVNSNPKTRGKLSVAFLPDYRVSLAEKIMPASEVSEQISLAGMEASGTGNMKFMMNGALTLGTYDGANVEIHREVGDENMFLFGLRTEDVAKLRPTYVSKDWYAKDPEIKAALDMIKANVFSLLEPGLFEPILRSLLDYNDYYMLLADLRSYSEAQDRVDAAYRDAKKWNRMSLVNVARSGFFSSDRSVMEYARDIWHISPVKF